MKGFDKNPQTMADVVRGFQKIATGGILDNVYLVPDVDGKYTVKLSALGASLADGTTIKNTGGILSVNADGTTIGIPAGGSTLAVLSPLGGWKNFIVNPLLDIWQRGTSKAAAAGGGQFYLADRWAYQWTSTTGAATVAQAVDAPDQSCTNSLKVTVTTAEAAPAAGNDAFVAQIIEGLNLRAFNGRTVTLSFWVKASLTGTYCVGFGNNAANKVYLAEYTVNVANTWEKKTITFVTTTTGTWLYDNTVGMRIRWCLYAGSTFQGVAGQNLTNVLKTANQVNLFGAISRTWQIAKVQFEIGPTATDFEWRPPDVELHLCRRYFETSYSLGTALGTASVLGPHNMPNCQGALAASTAGNVSPGGQMIFLTPKRAVPTVVPYDFDGTAAALRVQGAVNLKRAGVTTFGALQLNGAFQFVTFDNTSTTAIAKNDMLSWHWTADCEIF